jgi:hypothetical protein
MTKVATHRTLMQLTIIIVLTAIISSESSLYQIESVISKNALRSGSSVKAPIISDFSSSQYLSVSLSSSNSTKDIPVMR